MVFPVNHSNDIGDSNHPKTPSVAAAPVQLRASLKDHHPMARTVAENSRWDHPTDGQDRCHIPYIYTLYIYLVLYNIDVYMMIYMMIYMIYDMIYIYIIIYIHVSYVIMFVFIYACSSSHLCIHIFLVWTPLMIQQRKKCCFRLARRTSSSWQRNGTSVASPVRFRCRWWWH